MDTRLTFGRHNPGPHGRLVHAYFKVDLNILWQVAERDLPPLIVAVERALAAWQEQDPAQ